MSFLSVCCAKTWHYYVLGIIFVIGVGLTAGAITIFVVKPKEAKAQCDLLAELGEKCSPNNPGGRYSSMSQCATTCLCKNENNSTITCKSYRGTSLVVFTTTGIVLIIFGIAMIGGVVIFLVASKCKM